MPIITDIQEQRKNKNRFNIFIDGNFFAGASEYVIKKYKLEIGKEINPNTLKSAVIEDSLEKAKSYVLDYHLNKTEKTIRDKLKEKGYEEEIINQVIEFLHQYKYISDERYAKSVAKDAINIKKQGRQKIKMKLRQKGVKEEDIEKALEEVSFEDEVIAAEKLLISKVDYYKKRSKNSYELKGKLYTFLAGRGFTSDVIKNALERLEE